MVKPKSRSRSKSPEKVSKKVSPKKASKSSANKPSQEFINQVIRQHSRESATSKSNIRGPGYGRKVDVKSSGYGTGKPVVYRGDSFDELERIGACSNNNVLLKG